MSFGIIYIIGLVSVIIVIIIMSQIRFYRDLYEALCNDYDPHGDGPPIIILTFLWPIFYLIVFGYTVYGLNNLIGYKLSNKSKLDRVKITYWDDEHLGRLYKIKVIDKDIVKYYIQEYDSNIKPDHNFIEEYGIKEISKIIK